MLMNFQYILFYPFKPFTACPFKIFSDSRPASVRIKEDSSVNKESNFPSKNSGLGYYVLHNF